MKKKILSIIATFCAVCTLFIFKPNTAPALSASAYTKTATTYTVSTDGLTYSVKIGEAGIETDVQSSIATFEDVFSAIETHNQTSPTETIDVYFDNIEIVEADTEVTLSKNYLFSGSLTSSNTAPLFVVNNLDSGKILNLSLVDFVITNTAGSSIFEVDSASNETLITLNNAEILTAASTSNTYAFYFESTNHTVHFENKVKHSTTFLYNYLEGIELTVNDDTFFIDITTGDPIPLSAEKIKISFPYDTRDAIICSNISSINFPRILAEPDADFFGIEQSYAVNILAASSKIKLNLNTMGGSFNEYSPISNFFFIPKLTAERLTLPTETQLEKEYSYFNGWFGQVEYNSTTYYFDQICLQDFISTGMLAENIPSKFKTTLNDFEKENGFLTYNYNSKSTANEIAEYSSVFTMCELGLETTFAAKWNYNSYTVNYDTNEGSSISPTTHEYTSKITPPTDPTKTGFTFNGWFADEELTSSINFETFTMPANDITIYADWTRNNYTITFVTNTAASIDSQTYAFEAELSIPTNLSQTGFTFNGWFADAGLTVAFEQTTMPAENITLYASWSNIKYKVNFNSAGGTMFVTQTVNYGDEVKRPTDPTRVGYVFDGWYTDANCSNGNEVVFETKTGAESYEYLTITKNTTVYAKWRIMQFTLTINTNIPSEQPTVLYYDYGETISLADNIELANHKFGGWFADEDYSTKFTATTMPAKNIEVYAKWNAKPTLSINETTQTYTTKTINAAFEYFTEKDGFIVRYLVNDEWVAAPPTEIGSYDVMITRNEDNTYARFSKVLKDAFVIEPVAMDLSWLIILLFVFAAIEIVVAIVVRKMRKMKVNMVASFAFLIGGSYIPTTQVVLIIISGVLALFGFVLLIYELVKLHHTIPADFAKKQDDETEMDKHFAYSEKMLKEDNTSYSAEDIEAMLENDTVGHAIKEKHNLFEADRTEHHKSTSVANDAKNEMHEQVEIIKDDEPSKEELKKKLEKYQVYDSDDPFVRKDPNDYSADDDDDDDETLSNNKDE